MRTAIELVARAEIRRVCDADHAARMALATAFSKAQKTGIASEFDITSVSSSGHRGCVQHHWGMPQDPVDFAQERGLILPLCLHALRCRARAFSMILISILVDNPWRENMSFELSNTTMKAVLACTILASALTLSSNAHAGSCKTVSPFPGVVQLYGTAKDTTGAGDAALCTAVNTCPSGARKIEAFGGAVSTKSGATVAVSNFGTLADSDAIITGCDTVIDTHGKPIGAGICQSEASTTEAQANVAQQECTLYTTAAVGGSTIANATCFCGD